MKLHSTTSPSIPLQVEVDKKKGNSTDKNPTNTTCLLSLFNSPTLIEPINNYEALSSFIKEIRLRNTENAITWLSYLWKQPGLKSKMQRRILLSAGEDCMCLDVMDSVFGWYNNLSTRKSLELAAIEVARICSTPNWYAQPDGRMYMYAWEKSERTPYMGLPKRYSDLILLFTEAMLERNELEALTAFNRLYADKTFKPKEFAETLIEIAKYSDSQHAHRLVELYANNTGVLWLDGNISGQAVFALLNGDFGIQTSSAIDEHQVMEMLANAERRINEGLVIPAFSMDGIHTRRGGDPRFAGTVKHMAASCRAYENFGRLSPDDKWLAQFYEPENS